MKPVESYGVRILSIGFFYKAESNGSVAWPYGLKTLNQMIFDADWGELDFFSFDLPQELGIFI
jgi:ATP-binding protein involved in chromosome partitioning